MTHWEVVTGSGVTELILVITPDYDKAVDMMQKYNEIMGAHASVRECGRR